MMCFMTTLTYSYPGLDKALELIHYNMVYPSLVRFALLRRG